MTVYHVSKVALFSLSTVYCFAAFNISDLPLWHLILYHFKVALLLGGKPPIAITCMTFYVKVVKHLQVVSWYSKRNLLKQRAGDSKIWMLLYVSPVVQIIASYQLSFTPWYSQQTRQWFLIRCVVVSSKTG
jgi:hypothetical protein